MKRIVFLGLVAVATQLFGTGCYLFHPVERWRANHPCGTYHYHPLLHPIQTRRAIFSDAYAPGGVGGPVVSGSAVGPVVMDPPCHGCASSGIPLAPGGPVGYAPSGVYGPTGDIVPSGVPTIGYPMPITPGPKVIPSHELPHPMPVPKNGN